MSECKYCDHAILLHSKRGSWFHRESESIFCYIDERVYVAAPRDKNEKGN
jgi:hypothetical protein